METSIVLHVAPQKILKEIRFFGACIINESNRLPQILFWLFCMRKGNGYATRKCLFTGVMLQWLLLSPGRDWPNISCQDELSVLWESLYEVMKRRTSIWYNHPITK